MELKYLLIELRGSDGINDGHTFVTVRVQPAVPLAGASVETRFIELRFRVTADPMPSGLAAVGQTALEQAQRLLHAEQATALLMQMALPARG